MSGFYGFLLPPRPFSLTPGRLKLRVFSSQPQQIPKTVGKSDEQPSGGAH